MYLLIRYPAGIIVEAVVLAKGKSRMRVAVAGFPDTMELKRSGVQWFTEAHQPVEFEFLMSDAAKGKDASSRRAAHGRSAIGRAAGHMTSIC
jgi:hypothetical protein